MFSKTRERKQFLDELLASGKVNEQQLCNAFLTRPLRSASYQQNFGTVYTAVYRPLSESMSYHWPAEKSWQHSFADFRAAEKTVNLEKQAIPVILHSDVIEHVDVIEHAYSDLGMPSSIRHQILQSLVYLPVAFAGQTDALEKMKKHLRAENAYCWKDYAEQIAQVWHYPVSAN